MIESQSLLNQKIPDFFIEATNNTRINLHHFLGKPIVLFCYPKDKTPVCTAEAKAFRDQFRHFQTLNTLVFGLSRDSLTSHESFKAKLHLPFELISDASEELCVYFGILKMKNFFGKQIRGIERSTFLIDEQGIVRKAWRKVKVGGHVEEVLETIRRLKHAEPL